MSSYVLDKELLHSARVTTTTQSVNWIDVNSNTGLLGSSTYYKSSCDAEMKKQIADVNNRIRLDVTYIELNL